MKTIFIIWLVLATMFLLSWAIIITPVLLEAIKSIQNIIHNWANNNTEEQPRRQIGFQAYDNLLTEVVEEDDEE